MAQLAYREAYSMNSVEARKRMFKTYQEIGSVRERARHWISSRNVVGKWLCLTTFPPPNGRLTISVSWTSSQKKQEAAAAGV